MQYKTYFFFHFKLIYLFDIGCDIFRLFSSQNFNWQNVLMATKSITIPNKESMLKD